MNAALRPLALACLWLPLACGGPSGGDEGGSASTTQGSGSTTQGPGSTSSPGTTGQPGTGEASGDSASTTQGPSDGSTTAASEGTDGESSGTGPLCEPAPPPGNECLACVHTNCCAAWRLCMEDEPCACVVDCHVVQGNSLGMCTNTCNLDSDLYQGLYFCGQGSCLGSCDWDCC